MDNEKQLRRFANVAQQLPRHPSPTSKEILVQAGAAALTHWDKNPVLRYRLDNSCAAYQMFVLKALQRATNEQLDSTLCMVFGLNDDDFVPTPGAADQPKKLKTEVSRS